MLLTKYPSAGLIIGGDKNDLNISSLISGIPGVRQIVTKATHKSKILDIILTNLHQYYQIPVIVPPVQPDDPLRGVPSDHSVPLAYLSLQLTSLLGSIKQQQSGLYQNLESWSSRNG